MARITSDDAERLLGRVPQDRVFRCSDGRIMSSMLELQNALTDMSDDTFTYHSNDRKQDFSNWVMDVIGDQKLARDLAKSLNHMQAAKRVEDRIAFLSMKLAHV